MSKLTPEKIIKLLQLEPLPIEGGYFRRTYLSEDKLLSDHLPDRYPDTEPRSFGSAIYFLLTPDTYSKIHRLPTDEVYHFYLGDPVELLLLEESGNGKVVKLGSDLLNACTPQFVVSKGTWQGSRLFEGGSFALLGTTMAPAFYFSDFEEPRSLEELLESYPEKLAKMIKELY